MNKPLWIATKNTICAKVKRISDNHGGDDIAELRQYCRELVESCSENLQDVLEAVQDIERRTNVPRITQPFVPACEGSYVRDHPKWQQRQQRGLKDRETKTCING